MISSSSYTPFSVCIIQHTYSLSLTVRLESFSTHARQTPLKLSQKISPMTIKFSISIVNTADWTRSSGTRTTCVALKKSRMRSWCASRNVSFKRPKMQMQEHPSPHTQNTLFSTMSPRPEEMQLTTLEAIQMNKLSRQSLWFIWLCVRLTRSL